MPHRSFQVNRGRSVRRSTSWLTGPNQVIGAVTSVGIVGWTNGVQILEDGITLIRTRGEVSFRLAVTGGGITDGVNGAVGIAVASENAFAVGNAGIMDPFTDSEWDGWIWHSFWHVSGAVASAGSFQRLVIDSKAMRKIAALDVLYGVHKVELETGVETLAFQADTRMLFKLS